MLGAGGVRRSDAVTGTLGDMDIGLSLSFSQACAPFFLYLSFRLILDLSRQNMLFKLNCIMILCAHVGFMIKI
jgi:hypothetical protein